MSSDISLNKLVDIQGEAIQALNDVVLAQQQRLDEYADWIKSIHALVTANHDVVDSLQAENVQKFSFIMERLNASADFEKDRAKTK